MAMRKNHKLYFSILGFLLLAFALQLALRLPYGYQRAKAEVSRAQPESPTPLHRPNNKLIPPEKAIRAVQVIDFECRTWAEVDRRLAEWKEAGVQAVILRVFQNPGDGFYQFIERKAVSGVYFQTRHGPVVADVLGPICEMAHRKGLLVIAWMTTRYANYGKEDEIKLRCMAWDFGRKKAVLKKGYCPLITEAQDRICAIYADLARYPVDGVLIQDDLILKHTEGMNPKARELYKKATGKAADPDLFFKEVSRVNDKKYAVGKYTKEFHEWCRWKSQGLLLLAERVRRTIHASRPKAPVGLNLFYETLTDPEHSLPWFAQDLEATLESDMDYYAFMLYHRQMADELRLSRKAVLGLIDESLADLVRRVDYTQRIWIKVQSVDWDTGARIPAAEISTLTGRARRHGSVGLVVVPASRSLNLDALKESFR